MAEKNVRQAEISRKTNDPVSALPIQANTQYPYTDSFARKRERSFPLVWNTWGRNTRDQPCAVYPYTADIVSTHYYNHRHFLK